jgi:hypothetical protein
VLGIDLARARPLANLVAKAGRDDRRAPERPESFEDDRERDRRSDEDRQHRPAAGHQDFEHGSTLS